MFLTTAGDVSIDQVHDFVTAKFGSEIAQNFPLCPIVAKCARNIYYPLHPTAAKCAHTEHTAEGDASPRARSYNDLSYYLTLNPVLRGHCRYINSGSVLCTAGAIGAITADKQPPSALEFFKVHSNYCGL